MTYTYLGDKLTDPALKNKTCQSVLNGKGKCIRGRNGNMLVAFDGIKTVILAKRLRKKP